MALGAEEYVVFFIETIVTDDTFILTRVLWMGLHWCDFLFRGRCRQHYSKFDLLSWLSEVGMYTPYIFSFLSLLLFIVSMAH